MLCVATGNTLTNLTTALEALKPKIPLKKYEILKKVTSSNHSTNTEDKCLDSL